MLSRIRHLVAGHRILVVGLVGLAVLLTLSATSLLASPPGEPISKVEQELVDAVNAEREKHGLQPYIVNYSLMEAAWKHNEHMADVQKLGHSGIGDGDVASRVRATGYQFYRGLVGENVAWGQPNVTVVMEAWMNSPGHRANILGKYTDIGVAFTTRNGGPWWTQVFAKPVPPPDYVTVTPPAGGPPACSLHGDVDLNGAVTRADVEAVATRFMMTSDDPDWEPRYDLVADGVIDVYDAFDAVLAIGRTCPRP